MVRRQILITLTLALLGCPFLSGAALAQTALRPLPPALATLSDETGSLSPSQARALLKKLSQIEDRTTVKIIVLIAATVHPETIEAYVQRVIDRWKNSNSKLGSDRFIFVAIAKQDRAIRVVPGQQLSWVLEPFMTSGIMGETSLLLKRGDYYEALVAIGNELLQLIESNRRPPRALYSSAEDPASNCSPQPTTQSPSPWFVGAAQPTGKIGPRPLRRASHFRVRTQ